jgi:aminoglycoside phosphotransferase (APT) family kinase protein
MTPREAHWAPGGPRRTIPPAALKRMVQTAFPQARILQAQPLTDGLRNSNFHVRLDRPSAPLVLRIYEHDVSICQKEADLLRLLRPALPVPEVLHAAPSGIDGYPPFALLRYVEGITFLTLKRSGERKAIEQAARSVGETLASIGRVRFPKPGWLGPGPAVGAPLMEGADPYPNFITACLAQSPVAADLRARVESLVWSAAPDYAALAADPRLVHGDFGRRNLVVHRRGHRWQVVGVLDWEFAVSGSPLADIGHFLRYDSSEDPFTEPHFSEGYRAVGALPDDWRRLSRLLDLAAICAALTKAHLPDSAVPELVELLKAYA